MTTNIYRFEIDKGVLLEDVQESLQLAIVALQGIYGDARVRVDATWHVDESRRLITIDSSTDIGSILVCIFTEFLLREFGDDAFDVRRIQQNASKQAKGKAA